MNTKPVTNEEDVQLQELAGRLDAARGKPGSYEEIRHAIEWATSTRGEVALNCIRYGHQWRDDVPGIDGTVCVCCGRRPEERAAAERGRA